MKIILWGINYRPESTGIAPFNAELAEYLASGDNEVAVVTGFPYYPRWRKAVADQGRLFSRDEINGVTVYRCAQYVPQKVTTKRRILHELSFGVVSLLRVLFLPRADLYLVVSPPLFLGVCAWIVTRLKQSRYVFHVQDLQPGAAVGLGMVRNRGFIRMLYALESFAYRRAAAVSGISSGMMEELKRKGVRSRRRVYFPNWLRRGDAPQAEPGDFRRRFDVPAEHLLAVYSGNLGRKQGIDVLLEAAKQLGAEAEHSPARQVTILIAGAGAERAALEERVKAEHLPQLRLLPLLNDADYAAMLIDADVGLITQATGTGQYFFPSKLLSLLQAGLPVVTVADGDSELARAVADGGFGVNVAPGRADELAAMLERFAADRDAVRHLANRTHWVHRFSPTVVLPQFVLELERIVYGDVAPTLIGQREPSGL